MASLLLAGLLAASGISPAGDLIPEAGDFRLQEIRKAAGEVDWPFAAESGMLACTKVLGEPAVYFIPEDGDFDRAFHIDVNIMAMSLINLGVTDVLAPYDSPEQLLERLVPFVTMGQRLCDQEPGTVAPASEL